MRCKVGQLAEPDSVVRREGEQQNGLLLVGSHEELDVHALRSPHFEALQRRLARLRQQCSDDGDSVVSAL